MGKGSETCSILGSTLTEDVLLECVSEEALDADPLPEVRLHEARELPTTKEEIHFIDYINYYFHYER
jgi:hypothetical protein